MNFHNDEFAQQTDEKVGESLWGSSGTELYTTLKDYSKINVSPIIADDLRQKHRSSAVPGKKLEIRAESTGLLPNRHALAGPTPF